MKQPTPQQAKTWLLRQHNVEALARALDEYVLLHHKRQGIILLPEDHQPLLPLIQVYTKDGSQSDYVDFVKSLRDSAPSSGMQRLYRTVMTRQSQRDRRVILDGIRDLLKEEALAGLGYGEVQLFQARLAAVVAEARRKYVNSVRSEKAESVLTQDEKDDANYAFTQWVRQNVEDGVVQFTPSKRESDAAIRECLRGFI